MIKLNGIFPPLPTSFNANEELALDKMKLNIEKLNKYKLAGFLVLGSNGELVNLTESEKTAVYETARTSIASGKVLLAGTGAQSTKETIILTKAAAKAGVDAALVLNPSYYKGLMNTEALVKHYHEVAEKSTIPIIIYNMPANSGLDMDANTILEISKHGNIIGLKDSGGNIAKMANIRNEVKEDFQILAGSAGFLLPALTVGAIGGILASANIAPQKCIDIYEAFNQGKLNKAKELQLKIIRLNDAVTRKWGIPALKEAMDQLNLYGGPSRSPILPVNNEVRLKITKLLKKHDLLA